MQSLRGRRHLSTANRGESSEKSPVKVNGVSIGKEVLKMDGDANGRGGNQGDGVKRQPLWTKTKTGGVNEVTRRTNGRDPRTALR